MTAAQTENCVGSPYRPEHSRSLEAGADHGLAAGFDHTRPNKQMLAAKLRVAHALCIPGKVVRFGAYLLSDFGMIALGTPAELKASVPSGYLVRVRFGRHSPELLERLKTLSGVREVRATENNGADLYADRGGSLVSEVANLALAANIELCDVHISEPSLENLFLHHTGRSLRE